MKRILSFSATIFFLSIAFQSIACTNILVSRGASTDSSTFLVYTNDGEWLYHLNQTPAADNDISYSLTYKSMSGKSFKIDYGFYH